MAQNHDTPALTIGRLLKAQRRTVAVAESCTGGQLGACITSVGGSSDYFLGGVIAYSNDVKARVLGVDLALLQREGAVSGPVAREMARGVRQLLGADIGIAVTGIAGPGGGSPGKPVGLVILALADARGCRVQRLNLSGDRGAVRDSSCRAALTMLKECLVPKGDPHGQED